MLRMTADSSNEFHADQRKVRSLFVGKRKLEARSRTYEHCMIVIRARRLRPLFSTRVHIHNLPWFKKSFESSRKLNPSWHIRISLSMNEGLRWTWICIVWTYSRSRLTRYWVYTSPISQFYLARSRNEIVSCRTFLLHSMSDQQSLFCLDINIEIIIE